MTMARIIVPVLAIAALAGTASASFNSFQIRNAPAILPNNTYVPGATEFVIASGGQKGALGSNFVNGSSLGSITQMAITRHDDPTRFTAGSGPAVGPYVNVWITDGLGNYAVIANEPSNPSFAGFRTNNTANPADGYTYDFSFADIANEPAKVFETPGWNTNTSWVHTMTGQTAATLKFSHLAGLIVDAPSAAYIINGANGVGSGAPREFGTNTAYGFNWVFGDTLSNYVSGMEGYVVSNAVLVPAPGALALVGMGGLLAARRRR
jgi:hypothetical protein